MKRWFYRFTAVHFIFTSLTGVALFFRPGGSRPGFYSDAVKEWLVMIHNGEWISYLFFGRPFYSGILLGVVLGVVLIRHSVQGLLKKRVRFAPSQGVATPRATKRVA